MSHSLKLIDVKFPSLDCLVDVSKDTSPPGQYRQISKNTAYIRGNMLVATDEEYAIPLY